jgi:hypothetical protein
LKLKLNFIIILVSHFNMVSNTNPYKEYMYSKVKRKIITNKDLWNDEDNLEPVSKNELLIHIKKKI